MLQSLNILFPFRPAFSSFVNQQQPRDWWTMMASSLHMLIREEASLWLCEHSQLQIATKTRAHKLFPSLSCLLHLFLLYGSQAADHCHGNILWVVLWGKTLYIKQQQQHSAGRHGSNTNRLSISGHILHRCVRARPHLRPLSCVQRL